MKHLTANYIFIFHVVLLASCEKSDLPEHPLGTASFVSENTTASLEGQAFDEELNPSETAIKKSLTTKKNIQNSKKTVSDTGNKEKKPRHNCKEINIVRVRHSFGNTAQAGQ